MRAAARAFASLCQKHAWNSWKAETFWQVEVETTSRGIITVVGNGSRPPLFRRFSPAPLIMWRASLLWSSRAAACALRRLLAGHRLVAGFPAATLACHHARGTSGARPAAPPLLRLRRLPGHIGRTLLPGHQWRQLRDRWQRLLWQLRAVCNQGYEQPAHPRHVLFNRELLRQNPDR